MVRGKAKTQIIHIHNAISERDKIFKKTNLTNLPNI